jgi:DNA recombination protein RmuC
LGAFLNSLQMGFRSLMIQKRSGEVWQTLSEVKTEFEKYITWIEKVKRNIELTSKTLDEADTRTRAMARRLRNISDATQKEPAIEELDMNSLPSSVAKLPLE